MNKKSDRISPEMREKANHMMQEHRGDLTLRVRSTKKCTSKTLTLWALIND